MALQHTNDVFPSSRGPTPAMTPSKTSKSSSFGSFGSSDEDASVVADIGHFEEIGLEDDDRATPKGRSPTYLTQNSQPFQNGGRKSPSRGLSPSASGHAQPNGRTLASAKHAPKPKRSFPNLQSSLSNSNPRSTSLTVLTDPRPITLHNKPHFNRSSASLPVHRHRSPSPGGSLNPRDPNLPPRARRGSWQSQSDRKTVAELEDECDDDEEDDIPDGFVLDNVPLSPRPLQDRPPSRSTSRATSREPSPKAAKPKTAGGGTPAIAQAQGSLRSPSWKSDVAPGEVPPHSPVKQRARSWNIAHAELSAEARMLTEKLEEHADEVEGQRSKRPSTWNPSRRASTSDYFYDKKDRVRSTPELPPLRKMNSMIDPLPVSKEKEAVLSRTRPSWLPPKDPVEERRHLKQYQKMMAASQKADERREAARRVKVESKDHAVDNSMQIWERDILARWDEARRERRTREMWWKGIAPRSRGPVWTRAIGNDLGLTGASFQAALNRAREVEQRIKEDRGDAEDARSASWLAGIRKDANENTWKDLRIFETGGPLHDNLVDVLSAYAMYRNDIGYVSGCNTVAALLLLNLPNPETVFVALANLLNRPLPLSFITSDPGAQSSAYNLVLQTLASKAPPLHVQLTQNIPDLEPEIYLRGIFTSLFTSNLAIDEAARLWDVYLFEGDECLVWAAVAVLLRKEMALLGTKTQGEVIALLMETDATVASARPAGATGPEDKLMKLVREVSRT